MTNKPKQIGTWGESATLPVVLPYFPDAERRVQHGDRDQGDLKLNRRWIVEVKAGKQTIQVGPKQLDTWIDEVYAEVAHAGAEYGYLVIQRHGYGKPNAHRWWAYISLGWLTEVTTGTRLKADVYDTIVRMEHGELLRILETVGETDLLPNAA